MCCPFCGDREYKLGLNIENGKAHCFHGSCDWKSRGVVFTARKLCEAWGIDFDWRLRLSAAEADEAEVEKPLEIEQALPSGLPEEYEEFSFDPEDFVDEKAAHYLWSRGVGRAEIEKYRIGFAAAGKFAWRILFPVIGEDDLVYGCVGRAFSDIAKPKYLNTEGIKLLWNGQSRAKHAFVCEGVMDALAVERVARRWFPNSVGMASLGSAITAQQLAQLAKYETVTQFPDFDAAGVKGAMQRAGACALAGFDTRVIEPPVMDGSDPGSMRDDQIAEFMRQAKSWTKMQEYRMRLAALR